MSQPLKEKIRAKCDRLEPLPVKFVFVQNEGELDLANF